MDVLPMSQVELARELGLTEGAVSQVLNNQARLSLSTIIRYSRKLGLKVAVLAYDDNDPDNNRGPVNAEVFNECWERQGKPSDFFVLKSAVGEEMPACERIKTNTGRQAEGHTQVMKAVEE